MPTKNGVEESLSIAFMMAEEPRHRTWQPVSKVNFYEARAQLETVLAKLGLSVALADWAAIDTPGVWQPGHAAQFLSNKFTSRVGLIGFNTLKRLWPRDASVGGWAIIPLSYFNKNPEEALFTRP